MCGIVVWVNQENSVNANILAQSLALQTHRGPDNQSIFLWRKKDNYTTLQGNISDLNELKKNDKYTLAMGHARLKIIDLSDESNQPMTSDDGQYTLVFNGEIYNYIELRQDLMDSGATFYTRGDTEVLLKLLIKYGVNGTKKLNGMWSFAFFDRKKQQMVLSRDRFGKKPLLYYHDSYNFIISSEYKSIFKILDKKKRILNRNFLDIFLSYSFWPSFEDGATLYNGIFSLQPGCSMIFDIPLHSFKVIKNNLIEHFINHSYDVEELPEIVNDAVKIRLRSDVPIGILVSGGIDSSIISAYANQKGSNVNLYTAKIEPGNDLQYSRKVASYLGVKLREIDLSYDYDAINLIKEITYHYELPIIYNGVSLSASHIYRTMHNDGIKVVLDGTGGDEIFGGYTRYFFAYYKTCLKKFHLRKAMYLFSELFRMDPILFAEKIGGIVRRVIGINSPEYKNPLEKYLINKQDHFLYKKETSDFAVITDIESLMNIQINDIHKGMLPIWLYMNDRNSMMYSIETRSPLLDYRLINYIQMPDPKKLFKGFNKFQLRLSMPSVIGDAVRWRRDKVGFHWERNRFVINNLNEIKETIQGSLILKKLFNIEKLLRDLNPTKLGKIQFSNNYILALYSVAVLESIYNCDISI